MTRHKKVAAVAALTAAAALMLSGCSSSDNGSGGGEDAEVVFVDAVGTAPPHLNPQLNTDVATIQMTTPVFETLVKIDGNFELYPWLATDWEVNGDATEYTFHLRDDVKWHDGEPFTSADVKFNLEEVLKLHPLGVQLANVQENVETPDDTTVIVHLKEPFAPYVEAMSNHRMLPKHVYEGTDITTNPANLAPMGTGPFKFVEFVEGDRVVVEKNDEYWQASGDVDRIIFKIMPDTNARVLALQSGEVDRIASIFLDASRVDALKQDGAYSLSSAMNLPSAVTLFFNAQNGPTADFAVREALYTAIDRQAMVDNVYYGRAEVARGPIPARIEWAADPSIDFGEQFAFDREAAAKMLDEAGYPADSDGKRFDINIRVASGIPTFLASAEVIKSNLEEIGVGVNIIAEDLNVFVDQTYTQHNFDMALMSFSVYEDPSLGISRLYVCNPESRAFRNPTLMCDEELDGYFADAARTADRADRAALFAKAERRVSELLHTVPLVNDNAESVVRQDRWSGVEEFSRMINWDWTKIGSAS